jgi:hypothetical protein
MGNVLGGQGQGMGDALYGYAKIKASIGLAIGIIIGSLLIYGGYYISTNNNKTSNIQGKIKKSTCTKNKSNNFSCDIEYEFTVKDKTYNSIHSGYSSSYNITDGSNITVYYDEKDPNDSSLSTSKNIKYILYALGGFIIIGAIVHFALVFYSKAYGTITGGVDAASSIAGAFRSSSGSTALGTTDLGTTNLGSNISSSLSNSFNETFK